MTLREVNFALHNINRRRHNDFAAKASLYGVKIPMSGPGGEVASKKQEFSPEEQEALDAAMQRAMANKRRALKQRRT